MKSEEEQQVKLKYSLVAISGVPGTGKTTIAKIVKEKLKSKGIEFNLINVNELAKKEKLIIGFDEKRNCDIIDISAFKNLDLNSFKPCIFEGHISHFLNVDVIFVLRCDPIILKKRLKQRGWDKYKILENLESEIIDVISNEALEIHSVDNIYEIRTDKFKKDEIGEAIVEFILEGEVNKTIVSKPKSFLWSKYIDFLSKGTLEKFL